jgi:hypothetical protein
VDVLSFDKTSDAVAATIPATVKAAGMTLQRLDLTSPILGKNGNSTLRRNLKKRRSLSKS